MPAWLYVLITLAAMPIVLFVMAAVFHVITFPFTVWYWLTRKKRPPQDGGVYY
jgi:hypothetical protein